MELCNGGNLGTFIKNRPSKRMCEKEALYCMLQMSSGLAFLHSNQFMHRDLKPENVMICIRTDDGTDPTASNKESLTVKLGDFGFARKLEEDALANTFCGSPIYMV